MKKPLGYGIRILSLFLLLWGVAGCTNPLSRFSTPEKSDVNGEITIYTPMSADRTTPYLRVFKAKYPDIQVNLVTLSTDDILNRLLVEREDPQADVIWGMSATILALLQWEGLLTPYAPEGLERVYAQFKDTDTPPYWVGFAGWMSAFCVNPERLAELGLPKPESWSSLIDPIYAGEIALPSPVTSGTGYLIVDAILERYGEVKGWEYLDALYENVKLYTITNPLPCEMAANGEVAIGISAELAPVELIAQGKPIEMILTTGETGWDIEANALVRKDNEKDVAKSFLNWAIGDQTMEIYGESRVILSMPIENHFPPPGFPENPLTLLFDKDFPWASANYNRILAEWTKRYGAKAEELVIPQDPKPVP
jgi:iron(III) transport system substrate-binding protein